MNLFPHTADRAAGWRHLSKDRSGLAAVEFALIAPVFLAVIFGAFDAGQLMYGQSLLNGAVEKAARDSSLETGDTAAADDYVERIVRPVLTDVNITASRVNYFDFSNIDQPEAYGDSNSNGVCDNGEVYADENRNGEWDADVGVSGNGGSGDVVVYDVTATYNSAFVTALLPGSLEEITLRAQAVRKNQPFSTQEEEGTEAGSCS